MEHISAVYLVNAEGPSRVRPEKLGGRDYLVAPMRLLVPGVLDGSEGALYYPPEEAAEAPELWNGLPLVLGHPQDAAGNFLSARTPDRHDDWVGFNFRTNCDPEGKLDSEGWFDVARLQEHAAQGGNRVLAALRNGEKIELSTGLYTTNDMAPQGAVHNGKPYQAVARQFRPDHVAILLNEAGACSLQDGCGVLANASYFGDCPRDERGRCEGGDGGSEGGKVKDEGGSKKESKAGPLGEHVKGTTPEKLAMFLMDKAGDVSGTWTGKLTKGEQEQLFGSYKFGNKQITIDGKNERVETRAKVSFGQDTDTQTYAWGKRKDDDDRGVDEIAPPWQVVQRELKRQESKKNLKTNRAWKAPTGNASYFGDCERDEKGRCTAGEGSGEGKGGGEAPKAEGSGGGDKVASLRAIQAEVERTAKPGVTQEAAEKKFAEVVKGLNKVEAIKLAKDLGVVRKPTGKDHAISLIQRKVFSADIAERGLANAAAAPRNWAWKTKEPSAPVGAAAIPSPTVTKGPIMNRTDTIKWLTANCDCWKGKGDREQLNRLSNSALEKLKANALAAKTVNITVNAKGEKNAEEEGPAEVDTAALAEFLGVAIDPAQDPAGFIKALVDELQKITTKLTGAAAPSAPTPEEAMAASAANRVTGDDCDGENNDDPECRAMFHAVSGGGNAQAPTGNARSFLSREDQEDLAFARAEKNRRKQAYIGQLTANAQGASKAALVRLLAGKPLVELKLMAEALGKADAPSRQAAPAYYGASGALPFALTGNRQALPDDDEDDYLPLTSEHKF